MNQKKAKRLRRMAQRLTIGAPERQYKSIEHGRADTEKESIRTAVQRRLTPTSTRGLYLLLKKGSI